MKVKVIAIVVTYNRKELLSQVLESLFVQTVELKQILVIDNNSNDGTGELVRSYNRSEIVYHNTEANLGGAGGFYEGFSLAESFDYDYLWLMDDDFKPTENCLEKLLQSNSNGIVQPIRYNLDGTCAELSPLTYNLQKILSLNPKGKTVKSFIQEHGEPKEAIKIEAIPFEGPLIPNDVIRLLGKPEPKFFIFCDDIEYALKAKESGIPITCEPSAKAIRLLQNNQGNDMLSWKGYFMLRNLFYLHKKYGENIFIKHKPIVLALGYSILCLMKGHWKQIKVVYNAFCDSSELKNNEKYKPGAKR